MIEPEHPQLSIVRQCELVSISRSAYYRPVRGEGPLNLELLRLIDEQFLETPWYGSRQMARHLRRQGYEVGRKRVRRLMARMGLAAVYQRPRTTVPPRASDLAVLAAQPVDRPFQPGLVRRHHVHSHAARLPLRGRGDGLGDTQGAELAVVEHHGRGVLYRGARGARWRTMGPRRSSTPTKAANSPARASPAS